jgi:hypothetical protein
MNSHLTEHWNITGWNLSGDAYIIWICNSEQNTYFLVFCPFKEGQISLKDKGHNFSTETS